MAAKDDVQALLFDVFGTVVDWRTSLIEDLGRFGAEKGLKADWATFADDWRGLYQPAMDEVRIGSSPLDHPRRAAPREPGQADRQVRLHRSERGRQGAHEQGLASPQALARFSAGPDAAEDALHHRPAVERQHRPAHAHGQDSAGCRGT